MSYRTIARLRGLTRDAVKYHVANIKTKLGLTSRAELRQWPGIPANSPLSRRSKEPCGMADLQLGQIGQIARSVKDLAEAERFYRDVLGLRHLFTAGKLAFFDCGGTRLYLSAEGTRTAPRSGWHSSRTPKGGRSR